MREIIAYYGGAFNPFHAGHAETINVISSYVDEIWVAPFYKGKGVISPAHRVKMCQIGIREQLPLLSSKIKICTHEIDNKLVGGTYEVIKHLQEKHDKDFLIAIGQDNANNISLWRNWELLIKEMKFIVVPRNFDSENQWYTKSPHIFVNNTVANISSTKIRENINDRNYTRYLADGVLRYILDHDLYQSGVPLWT